MHLRYLLLAISVVCSSMSVAYADYQSLNQQIDSVDRLEKLSRTLSQGSYSSNAIAASPASSTSYNSSVETSPLGAWFSHHPIKDARVTSSWGTRTLMGSTRHHSGLDLAAPSGTAIYSTGPGVVTKSGWGTGYGNYVEIDHGNGYMTRYAHASKLNVSVGDYVNAGQRIANVGCTGRCTGPHLHFEVVKAGKRQNPATYLALLP